MFPTIKWATTSLLLVEVADGVELEADVVVTEVVLAAIVDEAVDAVVDEVVDVVADELL